jgi:uncharacterized protein YjbI with pentapeptide repeats
VNTTLLDPPPRRRGTRMTGVIARRASMPYATFDGAFLTHVDFSEGNLERTSWSGATAEFCAFDDAVLSCARFDGAAFTDCSFRGARFQFEAWPFRAAMAGARFVRCDLRGTGFEEQDLAGVELVACRLDGLVTGRATGRAASRR